MGVPRQALTSLVAVAPTTYIGGLPSPAYFATWMNSGSGMIGLALSLLPPCMQARHTRPPVLRGETQDVGGKAVAASTWRTSLLRLSFLHCCDLQSQVGKPGTKEGRTTQPVLGGGAHCSCTPRLTFSASDKGVGRMDRLPGWSVPPFSRQLPLYNVVCSEPCTPLVGKGCCARDQQVCKSRKSIEKAQGL